MDRLKKVMMLVGLIFLTVCIAGFAFPNEPDGLISSIKNNIEKEDYSLAIKETNKLLDLLKDKLKKLNLNTTDNDFINLLKNCKNPSTIPLPNNDELYIKYGDTKYYIIEEGPLSYSFGDYTVYGYGHLYLETKNNANIINNYLIEVNDNTEKIIYNSSNPDILDINKNGQFEIKDNGNVVIIVSLLDKKAYIPIKVIKLPLKEGMSEEEVIEILGMPDDITDTYISWPNSDFVDGIFYYRRNDGCGRNILHWFYDEYPDAIIIFNYNLSSVAMSSWSNVPRY